MSEKVTLGGKEFPISPLRVKHLKQITSMLAGDVPTGVYESIERFFPFMVASIQVEDPTFNSEKLEDATLDEINKAWTAIIDCSGIKIVTKTGETKPAKDPTFGETSLAGSPVQ
jgi:hypothetical protein